MEWMARKLSDPGCLHNVIELDGTPTGALRLDRVGARRWEVSIYVAPDFHGRGIARAALSAAARLAPEATLVANVLPENEPSHRLFRAAGYTMVEPGWYMKAPLWDEVGNAA